MNLINLLLYLILVCINIYANPTHITLALQNTNNYPYQTGNSNTINWTKPGILLEMFKLIEKEINYKIIFQRMPWKRALEELKHGRVDGLFAASYKQNRLKYGLYPEVDGHIDKTKRTHLNSYFFYKLKKSSLSWDGTSLKNFANGICTERGYSVVDDIRKIGVTVHEFNNTSKCMQLLYNSRVEGVAALEFAADSIINEKIKREVITNNFSFWLNWSNATLLNRIKNSHKRPIAFCSSDQELVELIEKRKKIYSKADFEVNCNKLSKTEIVKKIMILYEGN